MAEVLSKYILCTYAIAVNKIELSTYGGEQPISREIQLLNFRENNEKSCSYLFQEQSCLLIKEAFFKKYFVDNSSQ